VPGGLVVGDVMVDVVAVLSAPIALGSDAPGRIRTIGGGSAANTACWLAAAGTPVAFAGRVGADAYGQGVVAELRAAGVTPAVTIDPNRPTGTCVVLVGPDGERSMVPDRGANAALRPDDLPPSLFTAGNHLHLSGYVLLDETSRPAGLAALARAVSAGMTVSVDASSAAPLAALPADTVLDWLRGTWCLANIDEAEVLTGLTDPVEATRTLAAPCAEVVVTAGARAAVWCGSPDTDPVPVPPPEVEPVDTTGAGDAFNAGFLAAVLHGRDLRAALRLGNRVGALSARSTGGIAGLPRS
jgi:ribokinase